MAEKFTLEAVLKATGIGKFKQAFADAGKALGDFETVGKELQDTGDMLSGVGKGLTAGLTVPLVGAFTAATAGTAEFREEMAKVDTAFEVSGHAAQDGRDTFEEFYKVIGETDQSAEAVNHLAQLTDKQSELSDWTDIATGVFATFGDSLPLEGLTEAANETAKVGAVTGPLADALNWAGVSEDEFNKSLQATNSEQERATLITDTLNGLYDEAAEKYRENNESALTLRDAQLQLREAFAAVGEILAPVISKIAEFVGGLAEAFSSLDEEQQKMIIKLAGIAAAIGPVLIVGGALMSWIGTLLPLISKAGTLFGGLGLMFPKISSAIGLLGKAFGILMGPVGIVIAAIAGFIAIMVHLYNTNETVRNAINTAWTAIKETVMSAVEIAVNFVMSIVGMFVQWWNENQEMIRQTVETVWTAIKDLIIAAIEFITPYLQVAWTAIKETVMVVWTAISGAIQIAMNLIMGIIETVMLMIDGNWSGAWELIKETLDTAWNSMHNLITEVLETIRGAIMNVLDRIAEIFGVNMDDIKQKVDTAFNFIADVIDTIMPIVQGIIEGAWNHIVIVFETAVGVIQGVIDFFASMMEGDFEGMKTAVSDIWDSLWDGIKGVVENAWNTLSGAFSSLWDSISGWFTGLVDDAKEWGGNMISGFADGISGMVGEAVGAAKGVISSVGDYIKFWSPAKKGEGRYIEDWGANMILGFIDGVASQHRNAQQAMNSIVNAMQPDPMNTIDINGSIARSNAQVGSKIRHEINNDRSVQPAYINVRIGEQEFRRFTEDIFSEEARIANLEAQF